MTNPFLIGEKIYLRSPLPGDEKIYALSENHPDARSYLYNALPTSPNWHWEQIQNKMNDHNTILLTIATINPDEPVGNTAFVRIDWVGRMATFYIAIAESKNRSKGYGSEATRLMIAYAFDTLNFNRVQLHVSADNERAVKTYQKTGFRIEGTLRQAMFFGNRYHDFYVMGILKQDWEKINSGK
ncbi:MAG: GNAT family N-acetyltransferase [Calditrichaeota bacterium]|nr:GNAT family N-acetyltransferase [Calditrichota bacterium]